MPVRIPSDLPAREQLEQENIFVMPEQRAAHQDIRPLRIAVLNLMPTKILTETQILRLLGNTPLQVEVTFLRMGSHESKNTPSEHLERFYCDFTAVRHQRFDGLIITGAPVETLDFCQVDYWPELTRIMDWSTTNVYSTLHICWGAQAALWHHYGIPKHQLDLKVFGVFPHSILEPHEPIVRGFDEGFPVPHSRHTTIRREDILACDELRLVAESSEAGVCLAVSRDRRRVFVTGHPEYDRHTLRAEYERDLARGLPINLPRNYFPADNPASPPAMAWRSHAHLFYANWLNFHVYQETPFDLGALRYTVPSADDYCI